MKTEARGNFRFSPALKSMIQADINTGSVPCLLGEPGIGKSSWVAWLAEQNHTKVFTLAVNQLGEKADLTGGRPLQDADGNWGMYFFPNETVKSAIAYAKAHPTEEPLLFLDEINRAPSDVTSACLSLSTAREIGSEKLPDNLRIIVAGNDRGNVTALDTASVSRFVLYHVIPDVATFMAVNPDLNPAIKEVLSKNPTYLFLRGKGMEADSEEAATIDDILIEDDAMEQFTCPRTITSLSKWLNALSADDLNALTLEQTASSTVENDSATVLEEAIVAHVGNTAFASAVMVEILSDINNVSSVQTQNVAAKPLVWRDLENAPTYAEVEDAVWGLDTRDLSGCFVWSLFDPEDKSQIVSAITNRLDDAIDNGKSLFAEILTEADVSSFISLANAHVLNPVNVEALKRTGGPTWRSVNQILFSY